VHAASRFAKLREQCLGTRQPSVRCANGLDETFSVEIATIVEEAVQELGFGAFAQLELHPCVWMLGLEKVFERHPEKLRHFDEEGIVHERAHDVPKYD
jgi:hypothetical protein